MIPPHSGYDPATGVYEITADNAREWFGDAFDSIARTLVRQELEVLFVGAEYLVVRATPDAIWIALTGKPRTREHHDVVKERRRYSAMYLGRLVKPQLSAVAFNKRLDAAGLIYKDAGEWCLTRAGERFGDFVVAGGDRDAVTRTIHWDLAVLDVLGLDWPKPVWARAQDPTL
jgi:hypothetical protein